MSQCTARDVLPGRLTGPGTGEPRVVGTSSASAAALDLVRPLG